MKEEKNILEEPAASYGSKVRIGDIVPIPLENAEATLRAKGYISHEELVNSLSKYL